MFILSIQKMRKSKKTKKSIFDTPPPAGLREKATGLRKNTRTLRGDASQFGETEGNKYSDSGFCFRKNPRHPSDRLGCLHLLLRAFFVYAKLFFYRKRTAGEVTGKVAGFRKTTIKPFGVSVCQAEG
ncbi:MAG: hypothetical protein J6B81_04045 [Spirochaetaceae bacterium]|nr:hypothetical protein [Spirochaetaceae bacterium]